MRAETENIEPPNSSKKTQRCVLNLGQSFSSVPATPTRDPAPGAAPAGQTPAKPAVGGTPVQDDLPHRFSVVRTVSAGWTDAQHDELEAAVAAVSARWLIRPPRVTRRQLAGDKFAVCPPARRPFSERISLLQPCVCA